MKKAKLRPTVYILCDVCAGTGKVSMDYKKCVFCEGTGTIKKKPKV